MNGGHDRNRTGIQGFAVLCVTIPPRGLRYSQNHDTDHVFNLILLLSNKYNLFFGK